MSSDKTTIGDRMKSYEDPKRFMPLLPIISRLDGRAFHSFCHKLTKPFDERLHNLMVAVTRYLVEETAAKVGYTQSDEISLVWYSDNFESQVFFDGRIQKMVSILAAMTTMEFNRLLAQHLPEKAKLRPMFDCRVFQVPTLDEVANHFLWREQDATRNSIQAVGQAHFSHKQLQKVNTLQIQEMLLNQCGISWDDCQPWEKRGTWIQKRRVVKPFTTEELAKLPPKHAARKDPGLVFERNELRELDMPPFGAVQNRVAVIFEGADPDTGERPAPATPVQT